MKKIFIPVFFVTLLFSCNNRTKIEQKKCVVNYCVELVNTSTSIHEEINRSKKKWKIKTSCGNIFISTKPYEIDDTVTFKVIRVK